MQIALTGTPGTGKTSTAKRIPYRVIDINDLVKAGLNHGLDPERGCLIADMDALKRRIDELTGFDKDEIVILEGHFSHLFAPHAIVLRLRPAELKGRLECRGYTWQKVRENLEAEALDLILIEALETSEKVDEIDTTGKTIEEVADLVVQVVEGKLDMPPKGGGWLEETMESLGFEDAGGSGI